MERKETNKRKKRDPSSSEDQTPSSSSEATDTQMSVHDDTDDEFDFHDRDEVFNTTDEKDREKRRKHREEKELKENIEKASPDDQNLSSSEVRETIFKSPENIDKAKKSNTAQIIY